MDEPIVEQQHACLSVTDIPAAVDYYLSKLGFTCSFTWGVPPTYAGVNLGNVQMFLQKGTPAPGGCSVFFVVENADDLYEFHQSSGAEITAPIADRDYGMRDYAVRDLDGYHLSFGHRLWNAGEPIPIERVDVHVRLEKRLAALLEDLAKRKRMSVSSTLEEMLLHTNEGVGPHTKGTLAYIQKLKIKHGIDYDSHGSYRFVEKQ
jgi:uncharacterized glyoxalase superfamily protein PhnB